MQTDATTRNALGALTGVAPRFRPFNLLAHDGDSFAFATNLPAVPGDGEDGRGFAMGMLAPGLHGISNGVLNLQWPQRARRGALELMVAFESMDSASA